ncbi:MAG: hypothetical protein FWG90_04345 [Oscillospiraceae bacterium]|nr:hypothetical protein [Oscillospiraceae bacterium]
MLVVKMRAKKYRVLSAAVAMAVLVSSAVQYLSFSAWAEPLDDEQSSKGGEYCDNYGEYYNEYNNEYDEEANQQKTETNEGEEEDEDLEEGEFIHSLYPAREIYLHSLKDGMGVQDIWEFDGADVYIYKDGGFRISGQSSLESGVGIIIPDGLQGVNITLDNADIKASGRPGIEIGNNSSVTLNLVGESKVSSDATSAVRLNYETSELVIEGGGKLSVQGGKGGAGIGGRGKAEISGGEICAKGGAQGEGIGGSAVVIISGGEVHAESGGNSPGIGGFKGDFEMRSGHGNGNGVAFTIGLRVDSMEGVINGILFNGANGRVYGDVTLEKDLVIPSGFVLEVPTAASLHIPAEITLSNYGTIKGGNITGTVTNLDGGRILGGGAVFSQGGAALTIKGQDGVADWMAVRQDAELDLIKSISVTGDVTSIPSGAFIGCANLEEVAFHMETPPEFGSIFDKSNPVLTFIDHPKTPEWIAAANTLGFYYVEYSIIREKDSADNQGGKPADAAIGGIELEGLQAWTLGGKVLNSGRSVIGITADGSESIITLRATPEENEFVKRWRVNGKKSTKKGAKGEVVFNDFEVGLGNGNVSITAMLAEYSNPTIIIPNEEIDGTRDSRILDTTVGIDHGSKLIDSAGNGIEVGAGNVNDLRLDICDNGVSTLDGVIDSLGGGTVCGAVEQYFTDKNLNKKSIAMGFDINLSLDGVEIVEIEDGFIAETFALPDGIDPSEGIQFIGIHTNSDGSQELMVISNIQYNGDGTATVYISKFSSFFLIGAPRSIAKPVAPLFIDGIGDGSKHRNSRIHSAEPVGDNAGAYEGAEAGVSRTVETETEAEPRDESGHNDDSHPAPPPPPPMTSRNSPSAPSAGGNFPVSMSDTASVSAAPSRTRHVEFNQESRQDDSEAGGGNILTDYSDTSVSADVVYYAGGYEEAPVSYFTNGATAVSPRAGRSGTRSLNTTAPLVVATIAGIAALAGGTVFTVKGMRVKRAK